MSVSYPDIHQYHSMYLQLNSRQVYHLVWRNVFALVWLAVEVSLALYVGIGYCFLLGYLFIVVILVIPLKYNWVNSRFVKAFLGRRYTPDMELLLYGLSKSVSYRVSITVTLSILFVMAIIMLVVFNFKLIEFL